MKIVEIFSSIEGEGIRAGKLCTFIRTFGCNLRCSYCDSMYANEGSDYTEMTLESILEKCREFKNICVTLTGGEPLIQPEAAELVNMLLSEGFEVNIETNGSVAICDLRDTLWTQYRNSCKHLMFTIDYKTPSSEMNSRMLMYNFVRYATTQDVIKFVCGTQQDLECMRQIVKSMSQGSMLLPEIFVSPVFGKIEPSEIVEFLIRHDLQNVRMQIQMHKVIWDPEKRGV